MGALEVLLQNHADAERKLIITDGVFSMDGDITPLAEITSLASEYGAMVFVDEREGTIDEWKRILSWNTDGIQTDHPEALSEFLKQ